MSSLIEKISESVHNAKHNAHDLAKVTKAFAEEKLIDVKYVDLEIQFIGASNLPRMDAFGLSDPYFVASLHSHVDAPTESTPSYASTSSSSSSHSSSRISFVSTVQPHTLTPVWNELWRIRNVPSTADLVVEILDKDVGAPRDDYIGKFKVSVNPGAKECEIEGPALDLGKVVGLRKDRGTFWLKITSHPSPLPPPVSTLPSFLFAGPIRYSIHFSPTVGLLTNLPDARLYCTWKMYLVGVGVWFREVVKEGEEDDGKGKGKIEGMEEGVPTNAGGGESGDREKPLPPPPSYSSSPSSPAPDFPTPNRLLPQNQIRRDPVTHLPIFRPLHQHWNVKYKAAQQIFGQGPGSFAVRSGIQAGHRMLYARSTRNGFGVLGGGAQGQGQSQGQGQGQQGQGQHGQGHGQGQGHEHMRGQSEEETKRIGDDLRRLLCGSVNVNPNAQREPGNGLLRAFTSNNNNNNNNQESDSKSAAEQAEKESAGFVDPPPSVQPASSSQAGGGGTTQGPSSSKSRIKPTIYTYIISSEDDSFRFSETGAAFFVDFASKHALHANCGETVRYSGEFHVRPRVPTGNGWDGFSEDMRDEDVEWELVFDNNSGTYAPDAKLLPRLKGLLEGNFCGGPLFPKDYSALDNPPPPPSSEDNNSNFSAQKKKSISGFHVVTYAQSDPGLKQSVEATRNYALKYRGVRREEFEPQVGEGEVTLSQRVSMRSSSKPGKAGAGASAVTGDGSGETRRGGRKGELGVEGYDDDEELEGEGEEGRKKEAKGLRERLDRVEEGVRKMGVGRG
ncbi:hypothetical protein K435DRAFT_780765 [Dendrothele bispora CBS 962.96]|uniref:C2 domain-containing protein n=1 Tax=Dendrothele bispora (strain CBS 962.96) TaxID=1314807 RepID=A0A4V4HEK7_DENBC|nr:hypothetical protein K435DRAFT_780765 [Dendrothele bispora CBS 962.96]